GRIAAGGTETGGGWDSGPGPHLRLQPELPVGGFDRLVSVGAEDASPVAVLELLFPLHAHSEEARKRADRNTAERRPPHRRVVEGAVPLDEPKVAVHFFDV